MSTSLIRLRNAIVAARAEATAGTDVIGGSPAAGDWIAGEIPEITFNPTQVQDPTLTGALDRLAPIVGGFRTSLRFRVPLRGSGTAGAAPDWGALMRGCSMEEVVTTTAVGAPTNAAAGSTTTVTLATPAVATAQAYRGMPLILTTPAATAFITDYTAGRVATLGETLGAAAGASSTFQVPVNVLYRPTSDDTVARTITMYFYADGFRWRFVGCVGSVSLELTSGEIGFLVFEFVGLYLDGPSAVALPAGAFQARPTPPRMVGGKAQFLRTSAQFRSFSAGLNNGLLLPDDPEAQEGFGAGVILDRAVSGSADPYMHVTTSISRMSAFRNGTAGPISVGLGSSAGNRFGFTIPTARYIDMPPRGRDNLGVDAISFAADGSDSTFFLCQY